jgi:hypothetical protein
MATPADGDVKGETKFLPADDLAAIYDTGTKMLYMYARGKYVKPAVTSFVRQPFPGGLKFFFQGFYPGEESEGTAPEEYQFAEGFAIDLTGPHFHPKVAFVLTEDPAIQPTRVDILYLPIIQEA